MCAMTITVPLSTRSVSYTATAGQTALPVPFPVLAASDLVVTLVRGGGRSTLALSSAYAVTGAGQQSGAQVVLVTPALAGDIYLIEGALTPLRQTNILSNGPLPSDALNTDANALTIMVQELRRDVNRSIRRAGEDTSTGSNLLPDGAASSVLAFDANGNVIAIPLSALGSGGGGGTPMVLPVPVSEGGTGATDPATARADLGLGQAATLDSIDQAHLAAGAVGPTQIAAGAVTPSALALGTVTLVVEAATLTVPPPSPQQGMAWLVGIGSTAGWAGQANNIAVADGGGGWTFHPPSFGWRAMSLADQQAYVWNDTSWVPMSTASLIGGRLVTALPQGRMPGGNNRAAIINGSQVAVWGNGATGKACTLGSRTVTVPEIVPFQAPGVTGIQQLVCIWGRYFVIDQAGYPWAAGDGANYCLGLGDTTARIAFNRIPYFFNAGITIKKIVAKRCNQADYATVFLIATNGNLYSAGFNNTDGARGDGTTTSTSTPTQVQTSAGVPLTNVADVSAGGSGDAAGSTSVIALLSDGRVAKWGLNYSGQLATGNTTSQLYAVIDSATTQAVQVLACCGYLSTTYRGNCYVLLANGTILGAGDGSNGKLGPNYTGITNSIWVPITTPEFISFIAAGDGYTGTRAALAQSGKVYFWGRNNNGQQGLANTTDQSALIAPSASWQLHVTDVKIGGAVDQEACYVLANGTIYAAGYNTNANLCDGQSSTAASTFAPIMGIDPAATVSEWNVCGTDALYGPMVRTTDGRVFTGGAGALGELGWEVGAAGISPVMQDVLIRGQRGGQGPGGQTGDQGDAGFQFLWEAVYPVGDPGSGLLSLASVTPGATGTLAISKTTHDSLALGPFELQWGASSSTVKGQISVRDWANPQNFAILNVTGAVTDHGIWVGVPVQVVASGGTLANNVRLSLGFTRAGDGTPAAYPGAAISCYARLFA